jgi:hypothetical protein
MVHSAASGTEPDRVDVPRRVGKVAVAAIRERMTSTPLPVDSILAQSAPIFVPGMFALALS